jgi:hypothetical protein
MEGETRETRETRERELAGLADVGQAKLNGGRRALEDGEAESWGWVRLAKWHQVMEGETRESRETREPKGGRPS